MSNSYSLTYRKLKFDSTNIYCDESLFSLQWVTSNILSYKGDIINRLNKTEAYIFVYLIGFLLLRVAVEYLPELHYSINYIIITYIVRVGHPIYLELFKSRIMLNPEGVEL